MSSVLQGAKSKLYLNKDNIPGYEASSNDSLQHVTAPEISGNRVGLDVIIHGKYPVIPSIAVAANSVKRIVKLTAHGLPLNRKGLFLKPLNGNAEGEEVAILDVPDANTVIIACEVDMAIGDLVEIGRYITPNYTEDGDLNVVVTAAGPAQFVKDAATVTVTEDTVVPANNLALPSKMFIEIDGVVYPVRKDTGTPSNTVSIPVELSGVSGPVNITAGDLNVQLTDLGANFDRTRIGDGVNQLGVNASSEALVHDEDSLTQLEFIKAKTDNIPALGQALAAASVPVVLTDAQMTTLTPPAAITDFALEETQLNVETAVESIDLKTPALGQALEAASVPVVLTAAQITTLTPPAAITGFATSANQDSERVLLGAVTETAPGSDTASSGLNGRLQRVAENITTLIGKLPSIIGLRTVADSLSVTLASNHADVNTKVTALSATYDQSLVISQASAITLTAPTPAKWCKIMASSSNTVDLMVCIGGTATASNGMEFQPGRSEDYQACGNISVIAASTASNQKLFVQWGA